MLRACRLDQESLLGSKQVHIVSYMIVFIRRRDGCTSVEKVSALIRTLMAPTIAVEARVVVVKIHTRNCSAALPYLKAGVAVFGYVVVHFYITKLSRTADLYCPAAVVYLRRIAVADNKVFTVAVGLNSVSEACVLGRIIKLA